MEMIFKFFLVKILKIKKIKILRLILNRIEEGWVKMYVLFSKGFLC